MWRESEAFMMNKIIQIIIKNKSILLPVFILQICGIITFATMNTKELYGKWDHLFYFWRYGAFSLYGLIGGILCCFIPIEKLDRFFNKTVKRLIIVFAALAAVIFLADLFFYYSDGLVLKQRVLAWLDPLAYKYRNGYWAFRNQQIREAAQLLGGEDMVFIKSFAHDMVLGYIIGTFGWLKFGLVGFLALFLSYRMLKQVLCMNRPSYRFMATGIWIYITASFLWNIAMVFNWMPLGRSHFPFVSYARFYLIFDWCILGVFMRLTSIEGQLEAAKTPL